MLLRTLTLGLALTCSCAFAQTKLVWTDFLKSTSADTAALVHPGEILVELGTFDQITQSLPSDRFENGRLVINRELNFYNTKIVVAPGFLTSHVPALELMHLHFKKPVQIQ